MAARHARAHRGWLSGELYRAFDRDSEDNRAATLRNGKLRMPVLAVGGATSTSGALVEEMMREVAEDVTGRRIERTAHWVPEENATALTAAVLEFVGATASTRTSP